MKKEQFRVVLAICAVVLTAAATYRQLNPEGRYAGEYELGTDGEGWIVMDTVTGTLHTANPFNRVVWDLNKEGSTQCGIESLNPSELSLRVAVAARPTVTREIPPPSA
jgi:hypothetical protein